jgi:hypothetical protein
MKPPLFELLGSEFNCGGANALSTMLVVDGENPRGKLPNVVVVSTPARHRTAMLSLQLKMSLIHHAKVFQIRLNKDIT